MFHHVATETLASDLWKKLKELYDRKLATNKAFLFWKLVNLKYKEGGLVALHLNNMKSIVNNLASKKIVFDDELQASMLLSSFTRELGNFNCDREQLGTRLSCDYGPSH